MAAAAQVEHNPASMRAAVLPQRVRTRDAPKLEILLRGVRAKGSRTNGGPMSVRKDVDKLIDWWNANRSADRRSLQVSATANTVKKFARKQGKRGGPYVYRGYEIVPMRRSRKQQTAATPSQSEAPL